MRQLLPFPCDPVDPAALYGDLPSARTRPAVRLNMIASIDGATAVAGGSGGLGAGGDAKRILAGPALPSEPGWQLRSLCEQDGFLFLRYRPR